MTDPNKWDLIHIVHGCDPFANAITIDAITNVKKTFTRSNGTIMAKVYERLTKRSRRREQAVTGFIGVEEGETQRAYRRGVYDGFKALQAELE